MLHQLRLLLLALVLLALAIGLGVLAVVKTGSEVTQMDASLTMRHQVIWTVLIAGLYALLGSSPGKTSVPAAFWLWLPESYLRLY